MSEKPCVLVTGGSGFAGSWCVKTLLARGFAVNATLRPGRSSDDLIASLDLPTPQASRLKVVYADLADDNGWDEAADGCAFALHVASPTAPTFRDDPTVQLAITREGTLRVLTAAVAAGVERVVMTSTTFAMAYPAGGAARSERTEADWTDVDDAAVTPYVRAKTLAERDAWDFVEGRGVRERLTTIAPGGIVGPVLTGDLPNSIGLIRDSLSGAMQRVPRLAVGFVDARDLADLHVLAMQSASAGGERFIASGPPVWLTDLAPMLRKSLQGAGADVVALEVPSDLIRQAGLRDPSVREIISDLDVVRSFSSAKAQQILGWHQRPLADSLRDCAQSLQSRGLL
jgi:dihydroflavonol-4-reductase